jgi:alcohol dehydrogenase
VEEAMNAKNFRFYNPVKLVSGDSALGSLIYELGQLQSQRPLIITDPGVQKAGLIDIVQNVLQESERIATSLYDAVPTDSSPAVVNEAAALFYRADCDSIIAVGGGSVIDTGKAVNILVSEGATDILELVGAKLKKTLKPFIAVPTTAGTGSEVSYAAMIKDIERNKKLGFFSYMLFPNTAILDPRMTLTLPPLDTAATAMDALTHAIEAYICNQKNVISDAYSEASIRLISTNLLKVLNNSTDVNGRFHLANAACMAGTAFSNSGVGLVHALGHALGGICHVAHGVAMNIFLPHGLEFNISERQDDIGTLLLPLCGPEVYVHTPPEARAEKVVAYLRQLKDDLFRLAELPRTLREAGVKEESLAAVAQQGIKDPALNFNPVKLSYEDARAIIQKAF